MDFEGTDTPGKKPQLDKLRLVFDLERHGGRRVANFLHICKEHPEIYGVKYDSSIKDKKDQSTRRRYQTLVRDLKQWKIDRYTDFLKANSITAARDTIR